MDRSTSGHHLNGDRSLGAIGKVAYLLKNRLNNARPYDDLDDALTVRDFVPTDLARTWSTVPAGASPSRALSNLFWASLPWPDIHAALGVAHALDVGCGSGEYGPRLLSAAGPHLATYTGTDARAHERWLALTASDSRLAFYQSRAETFRETIPTRTNLFLSQSAIEHFDEDLSFFDQIRDHVSSRNGPVLQIHLAPSAACLWLYLWHGVRQYTPRTLSKITRRFAPCDAVAFRLGGRACNQLHASRITRPTLLGLGDQRANAPDAYQSALRAAIEHDIAHPDPSPAFWALVIHSRPNRRLFV